MTQRGDTQINTFVNGLITEASPLSFPQGASLDEINFKLKRNGTRERRLGLDLEPNYTLYNTGLDAAVLSGARVCAYRWSIPNGQSEIDIGVIQVGNSLYFINLYAEAPSGAVLNGGVPVTAIGTSNDQIMSFATINNYLVAVSNALPDPYLFSYNATTDVISYETAPILIRDLYGVDDDLDVNERPTTLSAKHTYNLKNQGWNDDIQTTCGAGVSPINCTFNTSGVYPSNSDIWSLGRIEDLTSADVYKFDPNLAARNLVQIGQASRGHFIIPIFGRGQARQDLTGLTLPADRETGAITYVASYAGRVFYAGILSRVVDGDANSPSFSGTVFFSQTFTNKDNLIKCYQEADPTSPDINDIIDTDGGTIQIPGCNYIYALIPTKTSLFVFGANGVWEIRGDEGGFRATSFQVNKISNIGVYAPKSIVEINNTFFFWGDSGIYTLAPNEFGLWDTTNITLPTIQRFYNAIPDASKRNARGFRDLHTNTARWIYYSPNTKQLGNPIDSDVGDPVVPFAIGSIVTIEDILDVLTQDTQVQNSSLYIVTVATGNSTANSREIWACPLSVNTVSVTANPSVRLDNSIDYDGVSISHCRLTDNKFIVIAKANVGGNLYAIVCTVSGTTITPTAKQLIVTDAVALTETLKIVRVDDDRFLISYINTAFDNILIAGTVSGGTTITLGAPTTLFADAVVQGSKADISSSIYQDYFYVIYRNSSSQTVNRVVNVSGLVVTLGATSPNLISYSGSTEKNINALNSNLFVSSTQNILSGSRLVVNSPFNSTIYTTFTNDTVAHTYSDTTTTTGNRIFHLYCAYPPGSTPNDDYVEMEQIVFNEAAGTFSSIAKYRLENVPGSYITVSNFGFTPTKAPASYVDTSVGVKKVKTFVWEAGTP